MTQPNERSDPVLPEGYREVTPEQLDRLHASCSSYRCLGPSRAARRANPQINPGRLEAMEREQARVLGTHEEPLAEWERELLEGAEAERQASRGTIARAARAVEHGLITETEALQAGLQHQRMRTSRIAMW